MTRLLLALLLCAACKHSSSSSSTSHTETQTTTDSTSSETGTQTTVTTTSEAPGKTTTTVEEFAPPAEGGEAPAEHDATTPDGVRVHGLPSDTSGAVSRPSHGPLVRRTVTVTERGEKDTTARQEATSQAEGATETKRNTEGDTKTKGNNASAPSAGCIGASWLWGAAVLAGIVGVLYFAIKMRKSVV